METLLLLLVLAAVDAGLLLTAGAVGSPTPPSAALIEACATWSLGALVLLAAHRAVLRRPGAHLTSPALLPAAVGLDGLGLVLQSTWAGLPGDVATRAPEQARLHLVAMAVGGLVVIVPTPAARHLPRLRPLLFLAAAGLVMLARWGPLAHPVRGQFVNLAVGPVTVQPMEAVKLLFAVWLALALAPHALSLHRQRVRVAGVLLPRWDLLLGAVAGLAGLLAGVRLLGDLGASLVLGFVTVALVHAAVGSRGWLLLGTTVIGGALLWLAAHPTVVAPVAADRMRMWFDPWRNGLPYGAHVVHGWWHVAAGGLVGVGPAAGEPLAEGATDLVLAVLAEAFGWVGGVGYLALLAILVGSAFALGARARTPERALTSVALGSLVLAQWLAIFGGVAGWLPLSGLATPLLSSGTSHRLVTWVLVGVLLRLGIDGARRAHTAPLSALRSGSLDLAVAAALLLGLAALRLFDLGVARRWDVLARDALVRQGDGRLALIHAPRVEALRAGLPRGRVWGSDGKPLRDTLPDGSLAWSPGWGTLSGPAPGRVRPERWHVEAQHDERLRGFGSLPPLRAWEVLDGEERRVVAVDAGEGAPPVGWSGATARTFPRPDLRGVVPLLDAAPQDRLRSGDDGGLDLHLSIAASDQAIVSEILARHADAGVALSAAVVDVDSGRFLALAQYPDVNFGDPRWLDARLSADGTEADPLLGRYGPWRDRTGAAGGVAQAGSVGKLYTALALARQGFATTGAGAARRGGPTFGCQAFGDRTGFLLPDWAAPIRDHGWVRTAPLDLADALPPSSNCWFAQAGLALGPAGMTALTDLGVRVGWEGAPFDPGAAGSRQLAATAVGQGAMALDVRQAAWLLAAVGRGGRYLACPDLRADAPCAVDVDLVPNDETVGVVLAGLRRVMTQGTGAGLAREPLPGVRLYGKTGTATAVRGRDEAAWVPSAPPDHAWMALLTEPASVAEASPLAPGRLAIVVLVFRGGKGAASAGPVAVEIARRLTAADGPHPAVPPVVAASRVP